MDRKMNNVPTIKVTKSLAKKWYLSDNPELRELALSVYTVEDIFGLPKTWEEYCKRYPISKEAVIIRNDNEIIKFNEDGKESIWEPGWTDVYLNKSWAKKMIIFNQLSFLKTLYNKDWVPDYDYSADIKYYIGVWRGELKILNTYDESHYLTFKDEATCKLFLINFKELIEQIKDLL